MAVSGHLVTVVSNNHVPTKSSMSYKTCIRPLVPTKGATLAEHKVSK